MKSYPIEVLIVEHSSSIASILKQVIQADQELKVVASLSSGEEALCYLQNTQPDVVVISLTFPHMNAFEITRQIMQTTPLPIIIMTTDFQEEEIQYRFEAFQAGALEMIYLPIKANDPTFTTQTHALVKAIHDASIIKLTTRRYFHQQAVQAAEEEKLKKLLAISSIQAIAIGASLGGATALNTIFSQLPAEFPVPIFVVQHIAAGSNQELVNWIQKNSPLEITLAKEGQCVEPGTVYFAPENFHLEIWPYHTIHLSSDPPEEGLRPSVSRLFRSMAKAYGKMGMGIILTGMGHDGAADLLLMKNSGAITVAQDQETAFVFGMPKEAIAYGAVQFVLSLQRIINALKTLIK